MHDENVEAKEKNVNFYFKVDDESIKFPFFKIFENDIFRWFKTQIIALVGVFLRRRYFKFHGFRKLGVWFESAVTKLLARVSLDLINTSWIL